MKRMMMALLVGMVSLLAGCTSVSDAAPSSMFIFPSGMIDEVVRGSVRDALVNPMFARYVMKFRAGHGGRNPVVKVGRITTDPPTADTKVFKEFLVSPFLSELHRSDRVEILDAEGSVVADIVLSLHVKGIEKRERGRTGKEFDFQLSMTDLCNGRIFWKYSKPMGFVTTD